jgi:6-phosphogluconolactonase (cycloisomerase 2 family)
VAYRVHQETGALERIGTYETGKTPIWVTCYESNDVADGNAPDDF